MPSSVFTALHRYSIGNVLHPIDKKIKSCNFYIKIEKLP